MTKPVDLETTDDEGHPEQMLAYVMLALPVLCIVVVILWLARDVLTWPNITIVFFALFCVELGRRAIGWHEGKEKK